MRQAAAVFMYATSLPLAAAKGAWFAVLDRIIEIDKELDAAESRVRAERRRQ